MTQGVLVVTGIGGMGLAIARRMGSGRPLVLADRDEQRLTVAATALRDDGYDVFKVPLDVADPEAVANLAKAAAAIGPVTQLVHTAGLSALQAGAAEPLYRVNLLGTAWMMEAFEQLAAPGMTAVFISSIARLFANAPAELSARLADLPAADLPALVDQELLQAPWTDPERAYSLSKACIYDRMRAAVSRWGQRGARLNTISPGGIATAMGRLYADQSPDAQAMLRIAPIPRLGTAEDIAMAVEFLCGPQSVYVTGTDLLVDGGISAAVANTGRRDGSGASAELPVEAALPTSE